MIESGKIKIFEIITFGNPLLRYKCEIVGEFLEDLHLEIGHIAAALKRNGGGAALAAPQVSIIKQVVVVNYLKSYYELINPEIVDASGEVYGYEGSLSLPGYAGRVKRFKKIKVRYEDRNGLIRNAEVENEMARCFQHEIDHLNGVLYIDRMSDEFVFNDETDERLSVEYLKGLTG